MWPWISHLLLLFLIWDLLSSFITRRGCPRQSLGSLLTISTCESGSEGSEWWWKAGKLRTALWHWGNPRVGPSELVNEVSSEGCRVELRDTTCHRGVKGASEWILVQLSKKKNYMVSLWKTVLSSSFELFESQGETWGLGSLVAYWLKRGMTPWWQWSIISYWKPITDMLSRSQEYSRTKVALSVISCCVKQFTPKLSGLK